MYNLWLGLSKRKLFTAMNPYLQWLHNEFLLLMMMDDVGCADSLIFLFRNCCSARSLNVCCAIAAVRRTLGAPCLRRGFWRGPFVYRRRDRWAAGKKRRVLIYIKGKTAARPKPLEKHAANGAVFRLLYFVARVFNANVRRPPTFFRCLSNAIFINNLWALIMRRD